MNTYLPSCVPRPLRAVLALPVLLTALLTGCQSANFSVPAIQAPANQPVVWHDLLSPEPDKSRQFMQQILGWQSNSADPYTPITDTDGALVGGIFDAAEMGWPLNAGGWLLSLQTTDLNASLEQVLRNGGKVLKKPREYPNRGMSALIQDPQGAIFELLEIDAAPAAEQQAQSAAWIWHELIADDATTAADWYAAVFDLTVEPMEGSRVMLSQNGQALATVSNNPFEQTPNQWIPVVAVDEMEMALQQVLQSGGRVTFGPSDDFAGGSLALVQDPTGAAMILQAQEMMP